LKNCKFPLIR